MVLSFLFLLGMSHAHGKEVHGITSSSSSPIAATGSHCEFYGALCATTHDEPSFPAQFARLLDN